MPVNYSKGGKMKRVFTGLMVFCIISTFTAFSQVLTPPQKKADQIKKIEIVEPTSIKLNRTEVYIFLYHPNMLTTTKEGYQLKATILPENATSKAILWESSDPAVVAVDNNGNLIPMKPGQAVVTATARANGLKAQCQVYVETTQEHFGNSFSNLANEGYLAVQNNWIYYANPSMNMVLHKMKLDGSGRQRLGILPCSFINVVGNKIFYNGNSRVNYIDIYGDMANVLTPNIPAYDIMATWGKVYFLSPDPGGSNKIYGINPDGTERNIIDWPNTVSLYKFFGNGNWFVFSDANQRGIFLKRLQSNGQWSGTYSLFQGKFKNYVLQTLGQYGGGPSSYLPYYIYVIDSENDAIRKIGPLAGSQGMKNEVLFRHQAAGQKITAISLIDDWLFYCTETVLSKMKTDGSQNQVVISNLPVGEHYLYPVRIGSDPDDLWIFVYTKDAQNKFSLLKVRHNGLDRTAVD